MTEYNKLAKGSFTSTGGAQVINLPFQPDAIEMWNYTSFATPSTHDIPRAYWDSDMGQGTAMVDIFNATPVLTTGVVLVNGFSTFSAGLALQYGKSQPVVSITKANPAVVTVTAHGYSTGQVVVFEGLFQTPTTGMPQMAGQAFSVTVIDANTFSVNWNTTGSNYTALTGSPAGATVKQVLYPFLYAPGVSYIAAITLGPTTTVSTTAPHNLVVGSEVAFRIPLSWGTYQLNSLPDVLIPGSPIYGYVTAVTNATTVVVNINSSAFTAYNVNQTVASMVGNTFPQMVAVGDVNSGGWPYTGGALYPSPVVNGAPTINGPAVQGAFVNNTSQGFIIGVGAASSDALSNLVGDPGDFIVWRAYYDDIQL
jgi:hypothetical protein